MQVTMTTPKEALPALKILPAVHGGYAISRPRFELGEQSEVLFAGSLEDSLNFLRQFFTTEVVIPSTITEGN